MRVGVERKGGAGFESIGEQKRILAGVDAFENVLSETIQRKRGRVSEEKTSVSGRNGGGVGRGGISSKKGKNGRTEVRQLKLEEGGKDTTWGRRVGGIFQKCGRGGAPRR